jgi:hypothetical protein
MAIFDGGGTADDADPAVNDDELSVRVVLRREDKIGFRVSSTPFQKDRNNLGCAAMTGEDLAASSFNASPSPQPPPPTDRFDVVPQHFGANAYFLEWETLGFRLTTDTTTAGSASSAVPPPSKIAIN